MPSPKSKLKKSSHSFSQSESNVYTPKIPSRDAIIKHLEEVGKPIAHTKLCKQMGLKKEQQIEGLRNRLIKMKQDGQVISNRLGAYGLAAHMDLIKGRIKGNKDGAGYFIPDDGSDDLFFGLREMEKLFDGDQVLARFTGFDNRGRREGTAVEILQRRHTHIVGRFYHEQGFSLVIPDNKRINHEILVPNDQTANAKEGQYVVAELVKYPEKRHKAVARIVEILGDITTPGLEIGIAVRSHEIPNKWPKTVSREIAQFPKNVSELEREGRFDLREIPFVTIDGEDAKDFDDAVFAHLHQRGNWTLYVAIADVSHYVAVGSGLDKEAINRGTSVYFPGHVIPMLPEKLSNGLCSLKPKVDRLAIVCEMQVSVKGEMTDYTFYEALIHSHARLTYTEVAEIVQQAETNAAEKMQSRLRRRRNLVVNHLDNLYYLSKVLRTNRDRNGALEFDTAETRIIFGEDKKIREIVPVERNDAHRLIEECMLSANVAAARVLEEHKLPALYRIHEGPSTDKLESLREYLGGQGLYLAGGDKPSLRDYQQVLQAITKRPDRHLLQTMLIRSMMQAVYKPENEGHFGLGFSAYTHFTSPIRRYPDLLVHRAIRSLIRNHKGVHVQRHKAASRFSKDEIYPYNKDNMVHFGEICSVAERRADAASYSVIDWLKCEYMQDHVGDEFEGVIAAVMSFGLFVELEDIYIEGLVHITELSNDYYHFDPVRHCLEGERRHIVYSLGDTVKIKVIRVDLDEKKIDLRIVGSKTKAKRAKNKNSKTNTQTDKSKTAVKKKKSKSSRIHKSQMSTPKKMSKKKISKGAHNKAKRKTRTARRRSS